MFPFPFSAEIGNLNINFIRELSSKAHFKGNIMYIKNQIGTIPLKLLVFHFCRRGGGVICSCSNYTTPRKPEKGDFNGMVPI